MTTHEYNEGDLVEAVKVDVASSTRFRGRVKGLVLKAQGYEPMMQWLEDRGFEFTLIEKAAPKLPTDPGAVIAWNAGHYMGLAILEKPNQWLFNDRNFTAAEMAAIIGGKDVTHLEPVPVTAKNVLDAVRAQTTMHCNGCADHLATIAKDFGVEA